MVYINHRIATLVLTITEKEIFMSTKNRTRSSETKKILDARILEEAKEQVYLARLVLLLKDEFFGTFLSLLQMEEASEWCPTAATDGRKIYYNAEFMLSLDIEEKKFVLAHEILHCIYGHIGRRRNRDPKLWNIATDLLINAILVEHKIGKIVQSGLIDPRYDPKEWTADEVYDDLLNRQNKGEILSYDEGFDIHLDEEDDENESSGENEGKKGGEEKGDKNGKVKFPKISKKMAEQIENLFKSVAITAAQNITKGAGAVPAGIEMMIKQITETKIDWREILKRKATSLLKSDINPTKLEKRSFLRNYLIRARQPGDSASAVIFIDASGSCVNEVDYFLAEVKAIFDQFSEVEIIVGCFDTEVYNVKKFDIFNLHEIEDYKVKGGGGTKFSAIFDYMKAENIRPELLVVFTDGMPFDSWGDPDYCDTIWIIKDNPKVSVPFGVKLVYERL